MNIELSVITAMLLLAAGCGDPRISIKEDPFPVIDADLQTMISADYLIGKGDELEVLYYIDPSSSLSEYRINTEDTLRIEFNYYPDLNKSVRVRPDGYITLQRIGDIKAADFTPMELADRIGRVYASYFTHPQVTVEVVEFNVKVEKLKEAIRTTTRGQSKLVIVRPDGMISLPYIDDVRAEGLTCQALGTLLQEHYRRYVKNISITSSLLTAHSNRAYVMGEVEKPDYYELTGPITLTRLIAMAGGFEEWANTHQIMIITRGEEGRPKARLVDMDNIIGRGDIASDPIIRQYDVVFVPRTKLSQAALVMNSVWSLIPLRFSTAYSLGGKDAE